MFGENNWIFRPLIVGGVIVAYEHFNNRGQPMMTHLKVGRTEGVPLSMFHLVSSHSATLASRLKPLVGRQFMSSSLLGCKF